MENYYCSFGNYMAFFNGKTHCLDILYKGKKVIGEISLLKNGKKCEFAEVINKIGVDFNSIELNSFCNSYVVEAVLKVGNNGVELSCNTKVELWGTTYMERSAYPMSSEAHGFVRCGFGPVCTPLDNMLFDVKNDLAIKADGEGNKKFPFNFEKGVYEFNGFVKDAFKISVEENVYADKYSIDYAPINKNVTFKKPPVGWMTWYAVMFDASEKTVLENSKWMAENLKNYGAETVWVDWEWYHKDKTGIRNDGCDTFNPDKTKYPDGMKYVSDEIRKMGLVPSFWIGFTNDSAENEFVKKHPDAVLCCEPSWCGQYFFDMSHPAFLEEFLPKALKQVDDWGYEAVKFDTLPICIQMHEKYHSKMHNPNLTTKEAYRAMIKKTRQLLGNDRYLLSCCGLNDSDVLWGCDMFDAARVGNDIFKWEEFIREGIGQTTRYYPLHNVVFYNDADNVIIREEYNTYEQAKSRTAFVGMLGLPVTFGDNLPDLPAQRVELLKRCIPVLDIHPMDVSRASFGESFVTSLAVGTECLDYNVVSVLNCTDKPLNTQLNLAELGIYAKKPVAYEYFAGECADVCDGVIEICLKPFETKVFSISDNKGIPQIISTSRHITQGATELENVQWSKADKCLDFTASLVEGDEYTVVINLPDGFEIKKQTGFDTVDVCNGIARLTTKADKNKKQDFTISF